MLNQISGIEIPRQSLSAATAPGVGTALVFSRVRENVAMQVSVTGSPAECKVVLLGTIDGVNFTTPIATFDTAQGDSNGDIKSSTGIAIVAAVAQLVTLTGGVSPAVTVTISAR